MLSEPDLELNFDEPSTGGQFAHNCLSLPGKALYCATSPDISAYSGTDYSIRAKVNIDSNGTNHCLISHMSSSSAVGWFIYLNPGGSARLFWRDVASGTLQDTGAKIVPSITGGRDFWIRIDLTGSTGIVNFYDSPDGITWTLQATYTGTSTGSLNPSGNLNIGNLAYGTTAFPLAGKIYRVILQVDGIIAYDADFTNRTIGTTTFIESSSNTALVTINGVIVSDSSVNTRDGAAFNGVTFASSPRTGKYCATFDGVNDYARVNAWTYPTTFTASAWIKPIAITGSNQYIMSNTTGTDGFGFYLSANSGFPSVILYNASSPKIVSGTIAVTPGIWQHVAATCNSNGSVIIYMNGVPICNPTIVSIGASLLDLFVGAWGTGSVFFFGGQIDNVRIYSTALSDAEIRKLYSGTYDDIESTISTSPRLSNRATVFTPFGPSRTNIGDDSIKSAIVIPRANRDISTIRG